MTEDNVQSAKIKPATHRSKQKTAPKPPKKITESYLHNSGLYYLQRFAASSNHFRSVMMRKIKKSCAYHKEQNIEECEKLLDQLITKFEQSQLLDDQSFARGLVNSLRRRGLSQRAIMTKAAAKGLPAAQTKQALEELDLTKYDNQGEADFKAAIILARKKRLGPFVNPLKELDDDAKEKLKNRHLAAFARAGYGFDISKKIIEMSREDAEEIYYSTL